MTSSVPLGSNQGLQWRTPLTPKPHTLRHVHTFHIRCRYRQHSQICATHSALLHNINNKTVDLQQQQLTRTPLCITAARLTPSDLSLCHSATRFHITHMTQEQVFKVIVIMFTGCFRNFNRFKPRSWERVHLICLLSGITETPHYRWAYPKFQQ